MTLAHRVAVMNNGVIEQLDTPKEIYNNPRTLFVAGFIGSPPMNLIDGEVRDGVFTGAGIRVAGFSNTNVPRAVLGVRPEDVQVVGAKDAGTNMVAPIYSSELTGESTLVSVQSGDRLVTMRADKNFAGGIDQEIGVKVATERAFLFDGESKNRVDFQ